jgi:glycerol-1-phosphate dehydrogenase [NAD(P)+]
MTRPRIPVAIGDDALQRLAGWVGSRPALVVCDANTCEACPVRLPGRSLVFEKRSGLVPGHAEIDAVRMALGGSDAIPVAVGSGVLTDIVRYAAFCERREFISVPTAASMDGYASSVAALHVDRVKVTCPARPPAAIFADPRVLAAAPADMTRAGIGDLLGKVTALVDWLGAHLLYGEPYMADLSDRVLALVQQTAGSVERLLAAEPDAAAELLRGLVESGLAIAEAGSSRPASGCEHHASHFWDLLADRGRRAPALHGLQVGYATRFAMRLERFAFAGGVPVLRRPVAPRDPLCAAARAWLGDPGKAILAAVDEKRGFIAELDGWPADGAAWDTVCARLAAAIESFDAVSTALDVAGIAGEPGHFGVDREMLEATFRYASRLRARYTVIDFLEGQGALDLAIESMLDA